MFNGIKTWLLRKGIWFLLILLGFIAYANLQPVWQQAADAHALKEAQSEAHKKITSWKDDSIKAIDNAQNESIQFLEKRIAAETVEIETIDKKINSLFDLDPRTPIYKKLYDLEKAFADWRKNRYEQIRSLKVGEEQRQIEITNTKALQKEKKEFYNKKLREYRAMPSGVDSGSEKADSFFSNVIKKANWFSSWSDYEIKDANAANKELRDLYDEIQNLQRKLDDLKNPKKIQAISVPDSSASDIDAIVENAKAKQGANWINKHIVQPASDYWQLALFAVVLGIAFSPLSRFLCFYFLAPIATRQRPITLEPNSGPGSETKECSTSGTNIELGLEPSDVLLVHHDYAKAIPKNCRASTQILLDKSSPFTSLASGLYNLVRIEPIETTAVDISSGHDGLNELMTIRIETGESIVIEPRNIVGIVIRQGKLITLRKHWVFNKLQPWLKWQFRYITISGPLTLVLKGGRGLVVSQLHNELFIEPEYVVAFSSSIGYGTSRTETFGGYYSRKKSLLKDHFFGSHGFVIHQEANLDSTMSSKKSGLEGVLDGLLKAFGI